MSRNTHKIVHTVVILGAHYSISDCDLNMEVSVNGCTMDGVRGGRLRAWSATEFKRIEDWWVGDREIEISHHGKGQIR